jgi:death-on-curing protein
MKEPNWLAPASVLAIHKSQLAEFGGADGIRDAGLFESAIARAKNSFHYSSDVNIFTLAADYAYGVIKNHPFIDGNKRTGFVAAAVFLAKNKYELNAAEADAYAKVIALAEGSMGFKEFAKWLRNHSNKI